MFYRIMQSIAYIVQFVIQNIKSRRITMKKLFAILLTLALGLISLPALGAEETSMFSKATWSQPENLGQPLRNVTILNSCTTMEDGRPVLVAASVGTPMKLNILDLESMQLLRTFDVDVGHTVWTHAADSKGNVYFAGYVHAELYKYSPADKKVTNLGSPSGEYAVSQIAIDEQDNVWMGTYQNAKLIKYDPKTNKMTDYGNQIKDSDYFKSLVYLNGYFYGGGMGQSNPEFVKIDAKTMKKKVIAPPKLSQGTVKTYYSGKAVGDKIFIWCEGVGRTDTFYVVLDTKTDTWVEGEISNANGLYPSGEIDGFAYLTTMSGNVKFDLKTNEVSLTSVNTGSMRGGDLVTLKENADFKGLTYAVATFGGDVMLVDFPNNRMKLYPGVLQGSNSKISAMLVDGDKLYASPMIGGEGAQFDLNSKTVTKKYKIGQSGSIVKYGGKIYFMDYPSCDLKVYDPNGSENPKILFSLLESHRQSRPNTMIVAGDKLAIGTIADYTITQGGVAIYDPATNEMEFIEMVKNQSITGLAYKDGILYASSTVYGGLGSRPVETEAKIVKYDMRTKQKLYEGTPDIAASGDLRMFGGLAVGPDGNIWTVADGLIFAMDPETCKVVKEKNILGFDFNRYTNSTTPFAIKFDSQGILYASPRNQPHAIDPYTLAYKDLSGGVPNCEKLEISGDSIYFNNEMTLYRVKRTDAFAPGKDNEEPFRDTVNLLVGSKKALVNGEKKELDVPAFTENDRTLVPVRFISESFGAQVGWEESTQTATVSIDGIEIRVVIGENQITVNGQQKDMDTAAVTRNDRTMLPLRVICESIGKKVFWDDRGLIVVGDTVPEQGKDNSYIEKMIQELK